MTTHTIHHTDLRWLQSEFFRQGIHCPLTGGIDLTTAQARAERAIKYHALSTVRTSARRGGRVTFARAFFEVFGEELDP